jgi:TolB protein
MRSEPPRAERAVQVTSAVGVESYPTWSPDGGRLAYESNQTGDWDIWVTQLGSSESINLTQDPAGADRFPSWSSDGQQIAYLSGRDAVWSLNTVSALGGRPRKLLSLPLRNFTPWGSPQWSPDGNELAVALRSEGRNFIEIVSLESRESRQISLPAHDEDGPHDLSWSADGRYFAYVTALQWNSEVTRLWIIPSSGGKAVPVTDGYTNVWDPAWSPDGRRLYFVSNLGGSMDLWEQTIANAEPERITTGLEIRTAALSPDGRRLAYSRGRREYDSNIWRVPILRDRLAAWADAEQLTSDNAFIQFLDVSPDGTRLVFNSNRAGNQDLWILPAEGGEMTQLTTHPTADWNPRWSPDGTEIAFYAYRTGNREIWVMPSEGGPARQITFHPALDVHPTWSRDGQRIAFTSKRTGNWDIWMVPASGGELQQITTDSADEGTPEWSPDGRWLGFMHYPSLRFLGLPASLRGEPRVLAEGPAQGYRWSRDGKFLYYTGDREKAGNLWAASLETGKEYPLTDFVGRRGRLSFNLATDGTYLYFHWDEDVADLWVMDLKR